jgi:hypothetical protein
VALAKDYRKLLEKAIHIQFLEHQALLPGSLQGSRTLHWVEITMKEFFNKFTIVP